MVDFETSRFPFRFPLSLLHARFRFPVLFVCSIATVMAEIADDENWVLASNLASSPEDLVRTATIQGVALQAVHFRRPNVEV